MERVGRGVEGSVGGEARRLNRARKALGKKETRLTGGAEGGGEQEGGRKWVSLIWRAGGGGGAPLKGGKRGGGEKKVKSEAGQ